MKERCPSGRRPDALTFIPKPQRLPYQDELDSAEPLKDDPFAGMKEKLTWDYRFFSTAHFPRRHFGSRGEVFDREGAMIYEGMQFSANCQGQYLVRFVVGTPATPVTMQLRFLLHVNDIDGYCRWHTVTLPPIEIPPPQDSSGRYQPGSWLIRHCGYSPALVGNMPVDIRREGSARFGFGDALDRL